MEVKLQVVALVLESVVWEYFHFVVEMLQKCTLVRTKSFVEFEQSQSHT
jgi:hypothetical protein